jgi:hypothetical protein
MGQFSIATVSQRKKSNIQSLETTQISPKEAKKSLQAHQSGFRGRFLKKIFEA